MWLLIVSQGDMKVTIARPLHVFVNVTLSCSWKGHKNMTFIPPCSVCVFVCVWRCVEVCGCLDVGVGAVMFGCWGGRACEGGIECVCVCVCVCVYMCVCVSGGVFGGGGGSTRGTSSSTNAPFSIYHPAALKTLARFFQYIPQQVLF